MHVRACSCACTSARVRTCVCVRAFASWQACAHVQTNMTGTRESMTGTRGPVTEGGGGEKEIMSGLLTR